MADKSEKPWAKWGSRYRELVREKESNLGKVAEKLDLAESTLRSWTNGSREINLTDFFALCEASELDPAVVLFGQPVMTEALRKQLGQVATSILEADPAAQPGYHQLGTKIRKSVRARKAAEARAVSRLKT